MTNSEPTNTPRPAPSAGFGASSAKAFGGSASAGETPCVPIADVECRVIIMAHPAFDGAAQTTANLPGAFPVFDSENVVPG